MQQSLPTTDALERLLHTRSDVWRARTGARTRQVLPTGFSALDRALHDGGWPLGATTELLADGLNWPLIIPALKPRLPGYVLLVNPPLLPSAVYLAEHGLLPEQLWVISHVGLHDNLWATDQALRAGCCSLVCQWLPAHGVADRDLRQLQQAAAKGGSWHVLIRPRSVATSAAPAALRLTAEVDAGGLSLCLLKQRGGWSGQHVHLALWPELTARVCTPIAQWPVHLSSLPTLRQSQPLERSAQLVTLAVGGA